MSQNNPIKTPNPVAPPQAPKDPEKSIQELETLKFKWVKDLLEWKQKKLAEMVHRTRSRKHHQSPGCAQQTPAGGSRLEERQPRILASAGEDCAAVKAILAELWLSSADMLLPDRRQESHRSGP